MAQRPTEPLTVGGEPLYKALKKTDKDSRAEGVDVVAVESGDPFGDAPKVRVLEKTNGPKPLVMIGASSGTLDTRTHKLVPLTGRNKAERELHALFQRLHDEREATRRERLEAFRARLREIAETGPRIERSAGLPIRGTPYVAGGGYVGATDGLDATVARAAEMLLAEYGRDVTVRFNSDRRSGAAFVVTDATDGPGTNAEIGLGGNLVDTADLLRYLRDRRGEEEGRAEFRRRLSADGIDPDNPPENYVRVSVKIGPRALLDPALATDGQDTGLYTSAADLEAGLRTLRELARHPDGIEPIA